MLTWLIPWAAECLNKFKVGADGLTCYEWITKRKCRHEVFGFGESVMWQMAPDKTDRDKLDSGIRDGIFLGVVWRSRGFLIGTTDGIYKTQTVKARPVETSYDPSSIDFITTRYSSYVLEGAKTKGAKAMYAEPRAAGPTSGGVEARAGTEWAPRRVYLKQADFERYSYTQGCPGCAWLQIGPESVSRIGKVVDEVLGVDIMEMYSPERVAKLCKRYDFDTAADRKRAWDIVHRDEPLLLIGSPPCTSSVS